MTYRVIQWATGLVGQESIKGIVAHPQLELVGCWVHSEAKVGRDAGDIAGIGPTGVLATHDIDAICAIEADAVVSLPRLEGRHIDGLPYDAEGFIPVDDHARVAGLDNVFAVGDVTNFPVKQGGIATQQADVAVESISLDLGCNVEANPLDPVLRGILWTGSKPRYLFGWLGGGHGETSVASERPPWPIDNPSKLIGRYLTPFLSQLERASRPTSSAAG